MHTIDAAALRLDALADFIVATRYLPTPPKERNFVGDGDFKAVGVEFLRHFVRIGGLRATDRVLDIGCGIGRMALPLTLFLDPAHGSYEGIDVVADGIAWCNETISRAYPNFRFRHLDLRNDLYNPKGAGRCADVHLPFADRSFDFIFMTSVLTHLGAGEMRAYAAECARLLADGGRCFVTAFLMNDRARRDLATGQGRIGFDPAQPGPEFHGIPDAPMAAVAFDENFLLGTFRRAGLRRRRPAHYGHWTGRKSPVFQGICVFEREDGQHEGTGE
jgi:SAM-dependent methyltransferase